MSLLGDALNAIQLKPRFLFGIALACVLVLVLPADAMGLAWLVPFRGWVSLVAILAFCFWIVQLFPLYMQRRAIARRKAGVLANLNSLSADEMRLLAYCLHRGKKTLLLKLTSFEGNVAAGLQQKGLITMATGSGNMLAWPHTIPEFVWQALLLLRDQFLPPDEHLPAHLLAYFDQLDSETRGERWSL